LTARRRQLAAKGVADRRTAPARSGTGARLGFGAAAIVAATLAVYAAVASFGFVSLDDPLYVARNPAVAGGLSWSGVVWAFQAAYAANWHPLTWISHMADVSLFGLDAGRHHLVNLALHVANTLLLLWALVRMTGAPGRSLVVAAIFALHPLHVESVAWIAERKDVLSGLFALVTIAAYAEYARSPSWWRYAIVAVALALGLLSKPMLVTLPCVLLLLDWWPLARVREAGTASSVPIATWRRVVVEKLPLVALSAMSSVLTIVAQEAGGALRAQEVYSFATRLANATTSVSIYLVQAIWPAKLAVFYPFRTHVPAMTVAAAALVVLGLTVLAVVRARRWPWLFTGWFWYLGMLVPVIGVVQVGSQAHADRYTYLPLVGASIALVWGLHALAGRVHVPARVAAAVAVVVLAAFAWAAHTQVQYWRDGMTLWRRAVDVVPDNFRAHASLGILLADEDRRDEAIPHLRAAVAGEPDFTEVHRALGRLLMESGDTSGAASHLREVVRLDPGSAVARSQLGLALAAAGQLDDGLSALEQAVLMAPSDPEVQNNLGATLAQAERFADAIPHFERATRVRPDFELAHFNLALALAKLGRLSEAAQEFAAVLRINPTNDRARVAYESLRGKG
jgi:Flp pilus assembly protein TadD